MSSKFAVFNRRNRLQAVVESYDAATKIQAIRPTLQFAPASGKTLRILLQSADRGFRFVGPTPALLSASKGQQGCVSRGTMVRTALGLGRVVSSTPEKVLVNLGDAGEKMFVSTAVFYA